MHNTTPPAPNDLPSTGALVRSTLIALAAAVALLVAVVLPAEYAVDPTGIGRVLGLTEMGEVKMQLAREAAVADSLEAALAADQPAGEATAAADDSAGAPSVPAGSSTPLRAHLVDLSLDPGEGLEVKLSMREGARVDYSWTASGGVVNFDTHADNESIDYFNYSKGTAVSGHEGRLVAAFDGLHGWFWRNRTDGVVSITLRVEGEYQDLKMP